MNRVQHLHKCYRKLRRKFPKLPKKVRFSFKKFDWLADVNVGWDGRKPTDAIIRFNPKLKFSTKLLEIELFHEVAHILAGKHIGHGHKFTRAIQRIYKLPDALKCL